VAAEAVRDTPEAEGWSAVTCSHAAAAVSCLASGARYDLIITDNHLTHVNRLEIMRYARRLEHREVMPIIMFCGVKCKAAAYQAGVNVFLKKPEGIGRLVETV
jgi:DNA-binding response OmpR family regulator